MKVLYVDADGYVRSGRLLVEPEMERDGAPTLVTRGGRKLLPSDVLELLEPRQPDEDERAALHRAVEAGYRVEDT